VFRSFLIVEEWRSLLATASAPRDAALLWLMAGCGLRVSEVAALKVEHLDGPGGYLHVVVVREASSALDCTPDSGQVVKQQYLK